MYVLTGRLHRGHVGAGSHVIAHSQQGEPNEMKNLPRRSWLNATLVQLYESQADHAHELFH